MSTPESDSTEVCVIPENLHCGDVADIQKAELAPGGSLLGCLSVQERLVVWNPADREVSPAAVDGSYTDFSWEEVVVHCHGVSSFRLLAVGAQRNLKLLEVEAERAASISLRSLCECPADRLLEVVREQDHGVCELQSVRVLLFAAGRCCLLLNCDWLLQLQWQQMEAELQTVSCCNISLSDRSRQIAVDHCVCRETLFTLSTTGLMSVYNICDGILLANIDLQAYLSFGPADDDLTFTSSSFSSPFCLLQVSADLSTAVAVTQSCTAVAVDLNHYFRRFPDHLLSAVPPSRPPLRPQQPQDEDGLSSAISGFVALGLNFTPDRSWEARLASLYSKAQQTPPSCSSSSCQPAGTSWISSLHHLVSHQAPFLAHSRVPHGGSMVTFSVPESSAPSLLTVSKFSAQLTFISPGNKKTTVSLWDFESGSVKYHQTEGEAAPVQRCGEKQHRLVLKKAGVFQVLFSVSQQDLLSRLMLFGNAATVDAVCHLNSWGRCSIPIHSLQAGLKNRQLDTVDFYLKSKENILKPAADQQAASTLNLTLRLQELCPALNLLCSAVRDSHSDARSRQFSEQLLNITMSFINTQIRKLLINTHYEAAHRHTQSTSDADEGVRSSVNILDRYLTELRSYMKRFPWPAGAGAQNTNSVETAVKAWEDEWEHLQTEEVVRQSILTNQIPRAQAVLRRRSCPEQRLSALRMNGLHQVFSCLQHRDLQTASTLLSNMGFSVKEQLHSICVYTDNKDLREFLVKELSERGFLSDEEMQSVAFIRQMEKLGSRPVSRCSTKPKSQRLLQMVCKDPPVGQEVLEELIGPRSEEEGPLWMNLRLDWVRNWDKSSKTAILLSRLQHTELTYCDPAVLWRYLTALHDQKQVVSWIESRETTGTSWWPELTPELINSNTMCSTYMRENILDLLARRGVFIADELADFEQLLWRLAQGGGVMTSSPPVPQYRSPTGLDFHTSFITFCLEHSLQYLLYTYLEHYRLMPRNSPLLADQSVLESYPWFEMMVKIQEIGRDRTDPGLVFQASLTSAQVLLPGSQASLNSLLLEGHSLLALATIMFAPEGIDGVMFHGERSGRSDRTVDPQLLKMALANNPKLKAALFPTGPPSDITVYHLMQSLHPLDPSRLFGWQAANTLNTTEASELPHFSSPHLVNRYALVENLDFLYYLRHGRPSFAYATFLVQQLSGSNDFKPLLQQAWQQVYRLALYCFNTASVTSACVCFCELLGLCSLKLRVDVRVLNTILQHWNQHDTQRTQTEHLQTLVSKGAKLLEGVAGAAEELIGYLETAVIDHLEQKGLNRSSYEAGLEWAFPVQFCQLHGLTLSSVYPENCARDGQFMYFLVFIQMHNFPPQQVRSLVAGFSSPLRDHLSLAFQNLQVYSQQSSYGAEEPPEVFSSEASPGSPERDTDLFQVLLRSLEDAAPCRYLLQEAVVQRSPVLTVMAACQQGADLLACLCVWVLTSVDDATTAEATSHLIEAPQHHEWTLHDMSIIWRTLLGRDHVRPLLRGFELFQRDCPLVLVLRMFELCCDYRNFSKAKEKLLDFQRTLITLRNSSPAPSGGLPLQWVESQASVLLLTLLQRSSSQYDLHRLLQLLADVDNILKFNGPDIGKLSQLSQLLQGTEVELSPSLLQCTSASVQQEEFQAIVEALQARGLYSQARQVAQLTGLPVHHLLLSQLLQEVNSQKSKRRWGRLETRASVWKKCHEQLKADSTDAESAAVFFQSQTENGEGSSGAGELLDMKENCLLLCLAAHWLSQLNPPPVDRLERLEKKLWLLRVQKHIITTTMEKESVFRLPEPPVTPEMNTYEVLMKEFSMSNISGLNSDTCLSLERFPRPSEEPTVDSGLTPNERSVLAVLIDQLLDEGSIHEASRACRYFSLYHPDAWLVLQCRGLASGDLKPDAPEEATATLPARSITTSSSVSSLLNFAMLSIPNDEVAVQLQKLVNQCRHGNIYCKQILSLYQLSKELQCSFTQICKEEPGSVMEKLLLLEQPDRFRKSQTFIRAQGLSAEFVAELISSAVAQALLSSNQELQPERQQVFRPSEGRDSLVQLIKLCEDPNLVGVKLLKTINTVPLRDLNGIVELLIVAHDCFSLTCNMEGIVRVLQVARHLSHSYLAPREHFGLLVRLLTGIGRYNEMTYVFDLLHQNHCFEILLRKKVDTDRGQSSSLKTALLVYLKRCLPADSEKHNMVALCFSMRREIGENHEMAARTQLKMIESQAWVVTPELKSSLVKVLGLLKDAAESFSKDSCVRQANRCMQTAKMVALQLHFLNQDSDLRVINLRPAELPKTLILLPRCYQVFIVSEAYRYSPDWAEILYQKVVVNGDFTYLEEFKRHRPLASSLFEDIFRKLDGAPSSVTPNVKCLLTHCTDVYTRYRLAYQQKLYDVTKTLLEDPKTASYLNDKLSV